MVLGGLTLSSELYIFSGATNRWKVVKIIFDYIHALQSQDVNLLRRQIEALHADNLQGFKSQDQIQVHFQQLPWSLFSDTMKICLLFISPRNI